MRPLRYSINVTLDGCCHHEAGLPLDEESMRYWTAELERADALLFGRATYEMMEAAWREGPPPEGRGQRRPWVRRGGEGRRVEHAERGRLECRAGARRRGARGSAAQAGAR